MDSSNAVPLGRNGSQDENPPELIDTRELAFAVMCTRDGQVRATCNMGDQLWLAAQLHRIGDTMAEGQLPRYNLTGEQLSVLVAARDIIQTLGDDYAFSAVFDLMNRCVLEVPDDSTVSEQPASNS